MICMQYLAGSRALYIHCNRARERGDPPSKHLSPVISPLVFVLLTIVREGFFLLPMSGTTWSKLQITSTNLAVIANISQSAYFPWNSSYSNISISCHCSPAVTVFMEKIYLWLSLDNKQFHVFTDISSSQGKVSSFEILNICVNLLVTRDVNVLRCQHQLKMLV